MSGYVLDLVRLRPDVRAAVLDLAERIAADLVAQVLADVDDVRDEAFWAGASFQRRYETHARDLAAWAASTPDRPTLLDRRGEPERAAAVRADLARRGLTQGRAA